MPILFESSVIFEVNVRNPKEHTNSVVKIDYRLKI